MLWSTFCLENYRVVDDEEMDAAVVQVSKPVWNSRHYDSAPVQPLLIFIMWLTDPNLKWRMKDTQRLLESYVESLINNGWAE